MVGLIACKYRLFSKKERSHYSVDIMHREAKRAEADVAKAFKADFDKFEKDHYFELYLHGRVDIDKSEKLCDEFLSKIE